MRFYLDVPLVAGYVLMATISCLGMLQLTAARGRYSGLSLFTSNYRIGERIGVALTVGAVFAYVLFAPEILTPGPAGTEVAEMFAICALGALGITLVGADLRMRRKANSVPGGDPVEIDGLDATFYHRHGALASQVTAASQNAPAAILLKDPMDFVTTPAAVVDALCRSGISVLVLANCGKMPSGEPRSAVMLQERLSKSLDWLKEESGVDAGRIAFVGCGLGGDVVLWAAETDTRIAAALGISPTSEAPLVPGVTPAGIEWLRELSYRQVWRWRRRWSDVQRTATALALNTPRHYGTSAARAVFVGGELRTALIGAWNDAQILSAPIGRHFSLLADDQARAVAVDWLRRELGVTEES